MQAEEAKLLRWKQGTPPRLISRTRSRSEAVQWVPQLRTYGHWAKDCRKPCWERANLAEEEEDGQALLMVEVCAPLEQSTLLCCSRTEEVDAASPKQSTSALFEVHLEEPRAQLHLTLMATAMLISGTSIPIQ